MKAFLTRKAGRGLAFILVFLIIFSKQFCPVYAGQKEKSVHNNSSLTLDQDIASGELERFTDITFDKYRKKYNIPGAVISIVKDGKVILSKGYGYADMEKKTPVNPSDTKFRIGSVTKLFTATVVMQLVEEGKINLEEDVNNYLKGFKLRNKFSNKVTMAQLLTHTSGIDSDIIHDLSKNESEVKPIAQFLKKRMLPVVREPGHIIQYSSYGIALAGCIVEEISGMSCNDYVTDNIFDALDMKNTSFEFNSSKLSKGYIIENGDLVYKPLEGYFNLYPVGGIVSTAEDMAKFMIAHLNNGEYSNRRIMKEATAIEMHSRHAGLTPDVPGTCYGFAEGFRNGKRTIGHPGYSADGMSTELCLFPENNIGIFIAVNQGSNNYFPQDFINYFIDRYFPAKEDSTILQGKAYAESVDDNVKGTYRFGEYTRTTVMKGDFFGAFEEAKVIVNKDATISVEETDPVTQEKLVTRADRVAALTYKTSDGDYIVFTKNNNGKVMYMAQTSNSWHGTYERINWYDQNIFQTGLFLTCYGIFLIELLLSLILLIKRLVLRRKVISPVPKVIKYINSLVITNSILNVMFFGISMLTWGDRLRYGVPIDIKLILLLPVISCVVTTALLVGTYIVWRKAVGKLIYRINVSIVLVASIWFLWFYNYYNFLGFKY